MEEKDKIKILKEPEQAIKMCKVISNKSFKDFNRYWIRQDKAFQQYSQCYCFSNEILNLFRKTLQENAQMCHVLKKL